MVIKEIIPGETNGILLLGCFVNESLAVPYALFKEFERYLKNT